jgi:hypothetical protein
MTTAFVRLAREEDWDLGRLTAASFRWPIAKANTVALRDVISTVPTDSWIDVGAPVITPAGLDPVGGGVRRRSRKYRGSVFQIRASGPGLNLGDLLLPRSPETPVLLVGSDLVGSLVSSQFLALRTDAASALWIWAVLNSRSGRSLRQHFAGGVMASSATRARLLDLELPWPSSQEIAQRAHRLADIEVQTHRPEEEASGTWWRAVDLRKMDWNLALATPDLEVFNSGSPLRELCREIIRGRPAPREALRDEPTRGFIPVTDIAVIDGKPVHRWVSATLTNQIVATPGDVFVAAVGNRPHAALATENSAVDRNLFLLRLHDPAHAIGLVQYLNGQTGYGLRRILLSGAIIPGLRKDALASLPVPEEVLRSSPNPAVLIPLAEQLEQALWS